MEPYNQETEAVMRRFYGSLSEKDRRRYAGIEALKYGHGGRNYIAQVLGCSRRTVSKGAKEVSGLSRVETEKRIRRNQWQLCCEIDGNFRVESVAVFTWNGWQLCRGICSRLVPCPLVMCDEWVIKWLRESVPT